MEHQNLIRKIVAEGQKNGYLTYSELNTMLPEDLASSPEQLDEIIGVLDERGIELIDDGDSSGLDLVAAGEDPLDIEDRKAQQAKEFESGQEEGPVSDPEGGRTTRPAVALLPEMVERIDDPVRMYLTQMGEIPLLTRDEEISLARKIELTRKQFRKLVLVSGFGTAEAISILKDVVAGELAFDRTIKVNQQDPDVGKSDLNYRLPGVISTLENLYGQNREVFRRLQAERMPKQEQRQLRTQLYRRMRKCGLLIEELNLQIKKVRPMVDMLENRVSDMRRLRQRAERQARQPPAGRLDRQEVPQPRALLPGHHPGGQHRPDARGGQVRVQARLQVQHLRDLVDPPGDHPRDRRPRPHDPHPGPHDRDDEQAAQHPEGRAAEDGREPTDRGARRDREDVVAETPRVMKISRTPSASTARWARARTPTSATSSRTSAADPQRLGRPDMLASASSRCSRP
jgi:hypothetical protein